MEENLFPRPAVRRILKEKFVQAWVHTDHPQLAEKNKELQRSYLGVLTIPYLVVLDPETRKELRRHEWPMDEEECVRFLDGD
jgi:hypothetical protein